MDLEFFLHTLTGKNKCNDKGLRTITIDTDNVRIRGKGPEPGEKDGFANRKAGKNT